MKTIQAHGKQFKFGRHALAAYGPRLSFFAYALATLPTNPIGCDWTKEAMPSITQVFGNDQLGDCVIAGIGGHVLGAVTGNAGACFVTPETDIIKEYSAIGGYIPGDESTDQGCNEETALNYYVRSGFADGTKALGWLAVDATNRSEVESAIYLFENVVLGLSLPDEWISPFPNGNGFVWDVAGAPNPQNGHCVVALGYNAQGVIIATWGMLGLITWAALAKYAKQSAGGECYTLITPDELSKGQTKAPNGFAWTDLISDFDAMGGTVPLPAPTPAPPTPAPPKPGPVVITLADAQAWAVSALAKGHLVMTRSQAEAAAKRGLAESWPTSS